MVRKMVRGFKMARSGRAGPSERRREERSLREAMTDRDGTEFDGEEVRGLVGDGPQPARFRSRSARGWVGIVANANSGTGRSGRRIDRLIRALDRTGLDARIAWSVEERSELAREAGRDEECVCLIAAGGDGTVSALINELPTAPVAVLPAGTENLFARHFGFDARPESLSAAIAEGGIERIDVGSAVGRRFALMAGFGFDADVVTRHHQGRVGRTGKPEPTHRIAYVGPVLRAAFSYRFPRLKVQVLDLGREETLEGTTVFVFNLPCYALGLRFAPSARCDDGLLDLLVFREPGALRALHYLWLVFRGVHLRAPGVEHRRVRRLSIEASETVPVQLDGDPGGFVRESPWNVEVEPKAVDVLVPPGYRSSKRLLVETRGR